MKRIIILLLVFSVAFLSACNSISSSINTEENKSMIAGSYEQDQGRICGGADPHSSRRQNSFGGAWRFALLNLWIYLRNLQGLLHRFVRQALFIF